MWHGHLGRDSGLIYNLQSKNRWTKNMAELTNTAQGKEGVNRSVFVIFCFCIAAIFVLAYLFGVMPVQKGDLVDSDCFVRLTRATDLYETGNWYHPTPMKTNTPYGDIS
ncbi:MAG: hypothetical protein DRP56_06875, partial [Planctomycetota bacterium]